MKKIEMDIECSSCSGTGVYVGIGERGGAGVVCYHCKGTGKYHYSFSYNEFIGRKIRSDITRVYTSSYGYVIAPEKNININGKNVDLSKEGVAYSDFCKGEMPKHSTAFGCPMLADQAACHEIHGFVDRCNKEHGQYLSFIPQCNCNDKTACWTIFKRGFVDAK